MGENVPIIGELYRHFKGRLYQVVSIATHSETGEKMVVYQALYGDYGMYVRPYDMFISDVDKHKYPEVRQKERFRHITREELEILRKKSQNKETQAKETSVKEAQTKETPVKEPQPKEPQIKETKSEEPKNKISQVVPEGVNPDLMRFLDEEDNDKKLKILVEMSSNIDERLMNSIEASLDIVSDEKSTIADRIGYVTSHLRTQARYETKRLRK